MKVWILFVFLCMVAASAAGYYFWTEKHPDVIVSPIGAITEKPLAKFTIDALSKRVFEPGTIVLDRELNKTSEILMYSFHFTSDGKNVSGVAHIPSDASAIHKKPVIVQFRGYVDPEHYTPGVGTQHSAEVFAQNGFISLAPDFLGYGSSDPLSDSIFLDRFETYTTALNLLSSIGSLSMADAVRVGLWGHSNGGQIALTVSEIVHSANPVVLWAPVTKPFPYSILYYTDDAEDQGKFLRGKLAQFEQDYDAGLYSLTNYLDRIQGPMQLHQGSDDDAVPLKWSDAFVSMLKEKGKDISYFIYKGADHDMRGSWNLVVARDIEFFRKHLQ